MNSRNQPGRERSSNDPLGRQIRQWADHQRPPAAVRTRVLFLSSREATPLSGLDMARGEDLLSRSEISFNSLSVGFFWSMQARVRY